MSWPNSDLANFQRILVSFHSAAASIGVGSHRHLHSGGWCLQESEAAYLIGVRYARAAHRLREWY